MWQEVNFDGLVGPTHHYSGLSFGNVASLKNKFLVSHPKEAALQGLEKGILLASLGIPQAVLPPHERPFLPFLRSIGFSGRDHEVIEKAFRLAPSLFFAASSSSAMWTANAATMSPSCDTKDQKLHITPANLISFLHRSLEAPFTTKVLKAIFSDASYFKVHPPLPSQETFADEGAANHTRFFSDPSKRGVHFFVYGKEEEKQLTKRYFPRQSKEAIEAIIRNHGLSLDSVVLARQNEEAIDAGVFHNDVIAAGNQNFLLFHEKAFADSKEVLEQLKETFKGVCQEPLKIVQVKETEVSLKEAVATYLFNSQVIFPFMICPSECETSPTVRKFLEKLKKDPKNPIKQIFFVNLKESMQNGGGPACLRWRVNLTKEEMTHLKGSIFLTEKLSSQLKEWIQRYYRDSLHIQDLRDPNLLRESREALDALTRILHLGNLYDFQS